MSQTHADSENKLVLRYWNCAGRGMLMRYMAYDADLDFIDDLVDIDEDFLGGTWRKLRFCRNTEHTVYSITGCAASWCYYQRDRACSQYVAEIAGYMPKSPLDRAKRHHDL